MHIFLLLPWLFLPFAQERILLWGLPVYPLEFLILSAAILLSLSAQSLSLAPFRYLWQDAWLLGGMGMFLLGALFSFGWHPVTFSTLGFLKSWFVFPVLFFSLALLASRKLRAHSFLASWLIGIGSLGLAALFGFGQGYLTFDHRLAFPDASPNFLAQLLYPGILLCLYFLLRGPTLLYRAFLYAGIAIFGFLLYHTRSYNVWLAGLLSLGVFWGTLCSAWPRKYLLWTIALLLLVGSGLIFLESGTEKWHTLFSGDERSSLASRLMIWQAASRMLAESPLFPIPLGGFQAAYLHYQPFFPPYLEWAVPQPHNLFLALWLQTGLLGLIGFLLLVGRILLLLWRSAPEDRALRSLLAALWAFFLLYGLFDTPYFRNDLAFLFWAQALLSILCIKKRRAVLRFKDPRIFRDRSGTRASFRDP